MSEKLNELLNKTSILDCDESQEEQHAKEILNFFERLGQFDEYKCDIEVQYNDVAHSNIPKKVHDSAINEIEDFIQRFDLKNGSDLYQTEDGFYAIRIYGTGYTYNDSYNLVDVTLKIMPYVKERNYINITNEEHNEKFKVLFEGGEMKDNIHGGNYLLISAIDRDGYEVELYSEYHAPLRGIDHEGFLMEFAKDGYSFDDIMETGKDDEYVLSQFDWLDWDKFDCVSYVFMKDQLIQQAETNNVELERLDFSAYDDFEEDYYKYYANEELEEREQGQEL